MGRVRARVWGEMREPRVEDEAEEAFEEFLDEVVERDMDDRLRTGR